MIVKSRLPKYWKYILYGLFLIVVMAATQGCCSSEKVSLTVTLHPQETEYWCWAASGQMVMDYLGHNVSQCVQANERFNKTNCCSIDLCPEPTEPPGICQNGQCSNCVCGGWPDFTAYNFDFKRTSGSPLSWDQIKKQIRSSPDGIGTPFTFSWGWEGGGGHMMVAKGYSVTGGSKYVDILDPWSPCAGDERIIPYSSFKAEPSDHYHMDDFYDITYTGGN